MTEKIDEEVAVLAIFDPDRGLKLPYSMRWKNRYYQFGHVDLVHPVWDGRTLHHIFSVSNDSSYFRLNFNSRSLQWFLEEISDGLAD